MICIFLGIWYEVLSTNVHSGAKKNTRSANNVVYIAVNAILMGKNATYLLT